MKPKYLILLVLASPFSLAAQDVLQHHRNGTRDGLYIDPLFTQAAAAKIHRDMTFHATLPGPTLAQPLYVSSGPGFRSALIVATEQNVVLAIDASDGSTIWSVNLGNPVRHSDLPCGNIDPLGVTGTPVIDPEKRLERMRVLPMALMLGEAISRIHTGGSVSAALFGAAPA